MSRDFHNTFKLVPNVIPPAAVGTSGATNGQLSGVIDLLGFRGATFIYNYGVTGATGDSITPVVLECATSDGTFTSVADADLIGTEADAAMAAGTRVSGDTQNVSRKLTYIGRKQFLKTRLYGLGTATAVVSASALLHTPRSMPAAGNP